MILGSAGEFGAVGSGTDGQPWQQADVVAQICAGHRLQALYGKAEPVIRLAGPQLEFRSGRAVQPAIWPWFRCAASDTGRLLSVLC